MKKYSVKELREFLQTLDKTMIVTVEGIQEVHVNFSDEYVCFDNQIIDENDSVFKELTVDFLIELLSVCESTCTIVVCGVEMISARVDGNFVILDDSEE